MNLFNMIRSIFGLRVDVDDDQPIDRLDQLSFELGEKRAQLSKAQQEFDELNTEFTLKIMACDKLIEKGVKEGDFNKQAIKQRLDRLTDEFLTNVQVLSKEANQLDKQKIELEGDILAKAIDLTSRLTKDEQQEINDIIVTWRETGLIKGEQVNSQMRAIVMALDEIVKGGEGSRGGNSIKERIANWDKKREDSRKNINLSEGRDLQKSHEPLVVELAGKGDIEYDSPVAGHYVNVIVKDKDGKILFLKRASDKVVAPDQYCLPGGHIDEGETIEQAACRELKEEANLECDYCYVIGKAKCDDGKWAFYLTAFTQYNDVALLDGESVNAHWMSRDQWIEADLIFDLKDHLVAIETKTSRIKDIPDIMKGEGDDIEKGGFHPEKPNHKYVGREGSPGNYVYYYDSPDTKQKDGKTYREGLYSSNVAPKERGADDLISHTRDLLQGFKESDSRKTIFGDTISFTKHYQDASSVSIDVSKSQDNEIHLFLYFEKIIKGRSLADPKLNYQSTSASTFTRKKKKINKAFKDVNKAFKEIDKFADKLRELDLLPKAKELGIDLDKAADNSDLEKVIDINNPFYYDNEDDLIKGKAAQEGEERTWGGKKYKKSGGKWNLVGSGKKGADKHGPAGDLSKHSDDELHQAFIARLKSGMDSDHPESKHILKEIDDRAAKRSEGAKEKPKANKNDSFKHTHTVKENLHDTGKRITHESDLSSDEKREGTKMIAERGDKLQYDSKNDTFHHEKYGDIGSLDHDNHVSEKGKEDQNRDSKKYSTKQIKEHVENTSTEQLKKVAKDDKHPHNDVAKRELERRGDNDSEWDKLEQLETKFNSGNKMSSMLQLVEHLTGKKKFEDFDKEVEAKLFKISDEVSSKNLSAMQAFGRIAKALGKTIGG